MPGARERRLVRAVCPKRHHLVAELVIGPDGHHVMRVPRLDVADLVDGEVRHDFYRGGTQIDLDDDSDEFRMDQRHPACRCGLTFLLSPDELLRAESAGRQRVVLRPRRA